MKPGTDAWASFVAGVIAAEAAFIHVADGPFTCVVGLGATDITTAESLHVYFGVGNVRWYVQVVHRELDEEWDSVLATVARRVHDLAVSGTQPRSDARSQSSPRTATVAAARAASLHVPARY